jgi:hypothetical protein
MFVSFTQDDWIDYLLIAEFIINNQINKSTEISLFFTNYSFNLCLEIEPAELYPLILLIQIKKEFFRADAVANCFKRILTQLKALAQISQQQYKNNTNKHRDKDALFKKNDIIIISLKNMKINKLKKK